MDKKYSDFWNDLKTGKFASMVKETSSGQTVSSPIEVFNIMRPLYAESEDVESLYSIFLNSKNKILAIEKMFSGSISGSAVYPREILKKVLQIQATAIIMVHNHPSGDPIPSTEDKVITNKIQYVLSCIDVRLHDHIIVGSSFFSMREAGLIERTMMI